MAMIPTWAMNIGIDSDATITKGNTIIGHEKMRTQTERVDDDGALLLGGEVSPYHRQSPWKKCWGLMKDGDLWQVFAEHARAKNPEAVKLTKVKGHATNDMVKDKLVRLDDMHGNNEADAAAEQGATLVQPAVRQFA